ncbi:hypothetical protein Pfo_023894 [Paulownia fortunei]|nr:hypothetical protein Pfo_023894 [Paulownia fortunei]
MAKSWEEEFWLISSILNTVLGLHLILTKLFSSWLPALPIFATVAADLFYRLLLFSSSHRHKNYYTTKRKIFESICLEIIVVSLSESMFTCMGYKWVTLLAWLAYGIPSFWATFRRPCDIPPPLPAYYQPFLVIGGLVLRGFWYGDNGHISQVAVGSFLLGHSSELFAYHLYLEAEKVMRNTEYYEWLVQQIRRGAIDRTQMLADLFLARGVYLPGQHRFV